MFENPDEKIALIRSFSIFGPMSLLALAGVIWPPKEDEFGGLFLSFLWGICSLGLLNVGAQYFGIWEFNTRQSILFGIPVDILIGWAIFWSLFPLLFKKWIPFLLIVLGLGIFDLFIMPRCEPLVVLHEHWFYLDIVSLLVVMLPSKWIYENTVSSTFRSARNMFQAMLYSIVFLLFFPAIILQNSLSQWPTPDWVFDHFFFLFQILFLFLFLGLSALQEFNNRGLGTPFPMDKTQSLVKTGPYAYLRNPMQLTTMLFFLTLSVIFLNPWFLGAALMTILYSLGYAGWQESADMEERFGNAWLDYKKNLPIFFPRWKPWRQTSATIYLDLSGCDICSDLGAWISGAHRTHLVVKDGREYEGQMRRMLYVDSDAYKEEGVRAFARALEHINLLYALFSFFLRLPIVAEVAQFVLDILAPPHRMCPLPDTDLTSANKEDVAQ